MTVPTPHDCVEPALRHICEGGALPHDSPLQCTRFVIDGPVFLLGTISGTLPIRPSWAMTLQLTLVVCSGSSSAALAPVSGSGAQPPAANLPPCFSLVWHGSWCGCLPSTTGGLLRWAC
jgi:hypothetical protein